MVSHNKRIVAALAAVAAMGIGLAGCGGSDTAGDTKSGSDGGVVKSPICIVCPIPKA